VWKTLGVDIWSSIIKLGERSYPVYVAPGLISKIGDLLDSNLPKYSKVVIVTSESIWSIHGNKLKDSLDDSGYDADLLLVPDSEDAKSWSEVSEVTEKLLGLGIDRKSLLISFGGGVVGDLTGFVAAIYLRGIDLIQIPTTLLSQVDSSIGGKTAINHPKGKNLIGAFKQPRFVASDPELLTSLPDREIRSGLAEVIKYGVISDNELFKYVMENASALQNFELVALSKVVRECTEIKGRYIEKDERDLKGIRADLNYGHTLGHAIETLAIPKMRHGEAIAIGMVFAGKISANLGILKEDVMEKLKTILESFGLDTSIPMLKLEAIMQVLERDKKVEDGSLRFVLPTGIGSAPVLRTINKQLVINELRRAGIG
jgi:3-dehydroquinate synthase